MDTPCENQTISHSGQDDWIPDGENGVRSGGRKVPTFSPKERNSKGEMLLSLPYELMWQIMGDLPRVADKERLMRCCKTVRAALFEKFYQEQFDYSEDRMLGLLLLCYASLEGHKEILRIGLSRRLADINQLLGEDETCSHISRPSPPCHRDSCLWLDRWSPRYLLLQRAGNGWRLAPLHFAVIAQDIGIVEELLAHSADANVLDAKGRTPLHFAIDEEMIKILLAAGASPLQKDTSHQSQMTALGSFLTSPMFWRRDMRRGPDLAPAALRRLIDATRDADPDWSIDHEIGWEEKTPLGLAVTAGVELVRAVLEAGANPNEKFVAFGQYWDAEKEILLEPAIQIAAALSGPQSVETMRLLVKHGARVNDVVNGRTALTIAVESRDHERVRWLIEECGADVNVSINDYVSEFKGGWEWELGYTVPNSPLWQAIRLEDLGMVELLIGSGADVRGVATLPVMVYITNLWTNYFCDEECEPEIAKVLLANGADVNVGMPMTSYYVQRYTSRDRKRNPHVWSWRVEKYAQAHRHQSWLSSPPIVRWDFEPRVGRTPFSIISDENICTQERRLESLLCLRPGKNHLQRFQRHRKWTMLDEAMVFHNPYSVQATMKHVDPLNQLTLSSQMRNTALGKLIRTVNHCLTKRSYIGPWTPWEWCKATVFLEFHGPKVTEKFPLGLLAQGLGQCVARLASPRRQESRIREYARLTNYNERWGADGISGLEALVKHPAYWHFHRRKHHLGGRWLRGERGWEIDDNLVSAAGVIHELSKRSSKPPPADGPQRPWWTTKRWECKGPPRGRSRYQPLPDNEYRAAFAVLFGEQTGSNVKSPRRKGRGRKKAISIGET